MIEINDLSKSFGSRIILNHLNLTVKRGETKAIIGRSGAGKSVLLKSIVGLVKPDQGSIKINGTEVVDLNERDYNKIRMEIGLVFQGGALFDSMNVGENVAFVLNEFMNLDQKTVKDRVADALALVGLKKVEHLMPSELSGGMKKRVGLARAIVLGAKVLLCDEPTSGLDPIRSHDISNLIRQVVKKIGATTVITSHDVANAFRIADRLAILNEGHIEVIGTKQELLACTHPFVKEFLQPASV